MSTPMFSSRVFAHMIRHKICTLSHFVNTNVDLSLASTNSIELLWDRRNPKIRRIPADTKKLLLRTFPCPNFFQERSKNGWLISWIDNPWNDENNLFMRPRVVYTTEMPDDEHPESFTWSPKWEFSRH